MAYNGTYFDQDDFLGGYCGAYPSTDLALNQAADLDNIVVSVGGKSFRTIYPTVEINTTEFGSANGYPVIGVGVFKPTGQTTTNMLVVRNAKAYGSTSVLNARHSCSAFVDRTGSVTIATGGSADIDFLSDRWNFCIFNDLLIGFGGIDGAQEAPFKWAGGANNIAALGGSPPSASYGFSANNRLFACKTAADPATIFWSILGNPEDWSGVGSGSAVVGSLDDGEPITAAVPLSSNIVLIFKKNSIHQMDISTAPFPNFLLFDGIGTINFRSAMVVDGVCYFMDIRGRMHSTDGNTLKHYSESASDLTGGTNLNNSLSSGVFPFCYRKSTQEYDWLVWVFATDTVAAYPTSVIWDLKNSMWLQCTTNFGFLTGDYDADGNFYGASPLSGRVFVPDAFLNSTNDSDGILVVESFWRTGWITPKLLDKITQIDRLGMNVDTRGVIDVSHGWDINYGFNFTEDTQSTIIRAWPDTTVLLQPQAIRFVFLKGKGNAQQFKIGWSTANSNNFGAKVNSIIYAGKQAGTRMVVQ